MQTTGMESPPFDLQAYEPPLSLWKLVEQHVPYHEREEIKSILGESVVDQSLELHEEINILLEIWRDYREETSRVQKKPRLPEPPGHRERLIQEIQFFVDNVKEKAKNQGVNPEKLLSRHNTQVLDYVLEDRSAENSRPSSRLHTARSADGRETPMIISPTSSDRVSGASSLCEEVESMNDKLTVLKFDEVVSHLRQTLEEETETLKRDINFLQNCLDDEATFRAESVGTLTREPTLSDLREERSTLEKELLSEMKPQTSPVLKPAFTPPSLQKLGPNLQPANTLKTNQRLGSPLAKPGPLKAFTSPVSLSKSEDTKTQTVQDRQETGAIPKSKCHSEKKTISEKNHVHSKHGERTKTQTKTAEQSEVVSRKAENWGGRNYREKSATDKKLKAEDHVGAEMSLEAVVTLSKSGDTQEVRVIPSPPNSGKPTTPRPSSAQRFRKMVLDSRESFT